MEAHDIASASITLDIVICHDTDKLLSRLENITLTVGDIPISLYKATSNKAFLPKGHSIRLFL
ncbi:hypothetical protein RJ47_07055 [Vibrio sinaloensis]|nr:hypothetical protein RJ47_07055 [Vibrio sinaloensis]